MSDDLIRRSDAIEVASRECHEFRGIFGRIEEGINRLPSADRPQGEWIDIGGYEVCKNCHEVKMFPHWNYCPNCGAKMKGADDEAD